MESFAERFAFALKRKGIVEDELAKKLGLSQQAISNWKHGKNLSKKMYQVAEELEVNPDWLIKNRGPMEGRSGIDSRIIEGLSALGDHQKEALFGFIQAMKGKESE